MLTGRGGAAADRAARRRPSCRLRASRCRPPCRANARRRWCTSPAPCPAAARSGRGRRCGGSACIAACAGTCRRNGRGRWRRADADGRPRLRAVRAPGSGRGSRRWRSDCARSWCRSRAQSAISSVVRSVECDNSASGPRRPSVVGEGDAALRVAVLREDEAALAAHPARLDGLVHERLPSEADIVVLGLVVAMVGVSMAMLMRLPCVPCQRSISVRRSPSAARSRRE